MDSNKPTRRSVLKTAGAVAAGLAAPTVWTGRAFGADQVTIADVGGAPAAAIRKAFYDPFEKETGIRVVNVAHESDPITQFKLLVDTKSFIWDLCMVTPSMVAYLSKPKDYLDTLNIPPEDFTTLVQGMLTPVWCGFSVFCTILAYRTDKFPNGGPNNWADYWNVAKFPGRRGLYKGVSGMLECALMADGVPAKDLYPIDIDRAFKMLDKIKPAVKVWWASGAQNTQILQSGEVDMSDTWGARAYADLARKFVRYCLRPEQQGLYSNTVANAPTNQKAYDYIKPERAALLATSPENIKGLVPSNDLWWAANRDKVQERFQEWLLG
jgi:putative spermidine/putrescine transport system substrate-binding protein